MLVNKITDLIRNGYELSFGRDYAMPRCCYLQINNGTWHFRHVYNPAEYTHLDDYLSYIVDNAVREFEKVTKAEWRYYNER